MLDVTLHRLLAHFEIYLFNRVTRYWMADFIIFLDNINTIIRLYNYKIDYTFSFGTKVKLHTYCNRKIFENSLVPKSWKYFYVIFFEDVVYERKYHF